MALIEYVKSLQGSGGAAVPAEEARAEPAASAAPQENR
jgi:hypothetical protein